MDTTQSLLFRNIADRMPPARQQFDDEIHRMQFKAGSPYPHLLVDGLFDDDLLDAIHTEFDHYPRWHAIEKTQEGNRRSTCAESFGNATRRYFDLVHSPRFMRYLSTVIGIPNLIADTNLVGGGLHETRSAGFFALHRDFPYHRGTKLQNAAVLITYLNRDWEPEFGGDLVLSDGAESTKRIAPIFGRTVLIARPDLYYHGCPEPLTAPPGRVRRSIATYFYVNPHAERACVRRTRYLDHGPGEQLRWAAHSLMPPIAWTLGKWCDGNLRRFLGQALARVPIMPRSVLRSGR
jgi:Rps23 Pro-64 3,4-dihydroxylase Tpa1-like proline 4-hydroxylase